MAIFHSHTSIGSRSQGHSAVAKAAYNAACKLVEKIVDKATGIITEITHDYTKKQGVVFSKIYMPEIAEGMFESREDLWNQVHAREIRKNAQLSRNMTFALPKELSQKENEELVEKYINECFVSEGMIADTNIHYDNDNNPHLHIMLTMRRIEKNEFGDKYFGNKVRSWNETPTLVHWRAMWAAYVNKELEVRGFHDRISHLSHEARGINLDATIHEGVSTQRIDNSERVALNAGIKQSNNERIRENPELIIDKLSINKAAFTKVEIAREVGKYFGVSVGKNDTDLESLNQINAAEFLNAYEKVLSSDKLTIVSKDSLSGEILYTSSVRIKLEQRLLNTVSKLNEDYSHSLAISEKELGEFSIAEIIKENIKGVGKAIESTLGIDLGIREGIELSDKQKAAVLHALNGPSISVIEGLPGAGKSTVVKEISRQLQKAGYRVVGGAVSSSASRNLAEAGDIFTQNLTKWRYDIERFERDITGEKFNPSLPLNYHETELYQKRPSYFTNKDIFIIDEMSMVSLPDLDFIKNEILKAGGKIIDLGDNNQLGAIKLQGASNKVTDITGSFVLDEVRRQANPLHRKATVLMSDYKLKEALQIYDETKVFETAPTREQLREKLAHDYASQYLKVAKEEGLDHLSTYGKMAIIAYTNDEVRALNLLVREKLKTAGIIKGEVFKLTNGTGSLELGIGEQIVFTRNDKRQGVENGDVGILRSHQGNVLSIEVIRDNKSYNVNIDTKDYKSIDYGYALTIYKAQGKTYDYVRALFESLTGYQVFNVMMTRHVKELKCYIDQDMIESNLHNNVEYREHEKLTSAILNSITRRTKSDFSLDYMNSDSLPEVKILKAYIEAKEDTLELHNAIEREKDLVYKRDGVHISTWETKYAQDYKEVLAERKQLAQEICKDFDSYKGLISQTRLSFDVIAAHAGLEGYKKDYSTDKQNAGVKTVNSSIADKSIIELASSLNEIATGEHGPLFEGASEPLRASIHSLSNQLVHEHDEKALSIKSLELKAHDLRQAKYKAEADLTNAKYFVEEAFPYILNRTFKDGEKALKAWNILREEKGFSGALHIVHKDVSILGKLQGMGIGNLFALSSARVDALSNVKQLPQSLKKFEDFKVTIQDIAQELEKKHWDKEIAMIQTKIKELESNMLDETTYEFVKEIRDEATKADSLIKFAKTAAVQAWTDRISQANKIEDLDKVIDKQASEQHTMDKDDQYKQGYNSYKNNNKAKGCKIERESLFFDEVNHKLTRYTKELGYELLPQITGDKVEAVKAGVLKCGSIMLQTEGSKAGLWFRFSRGEGGNLFDLIKEANGHSSSVESLKWGAEWLGMSQDEYTVKHDQTIDKEHQVSKLAPVKTKDVAWKTVSIVPENAPVPNIDKCFSKLKTTHTHEATYEYKDIKGDVIGYVVRFKDKETRLKQTLPLVWAENLKTGRQGWRSQGFEGKPLYGLEKLFQDRKTVLIVEGEKAADAASKLLPEYTVISWLGGTNSADKVDWKALEGRKVVIWPDCDEPGMKAARTIAGRLDNLAKEVVVVNPNMLKFEGRVHENILPDKWDLADELPKIMSHAHIKEAIINAQESKFELTTTNIKAALDKLQGQDKGKATIRDKSILNDQALYSEVFKQAKELAGLSREYPDSESLVKVVYKEVQASHNLIKDTSYAAIQNSFELNEFVREGAIANRFHENLLSRLIAKELELGTNRTNMNISTNKVNRIQYTVGINSNLETKLSYAINAYIKTEKNLDLLHKDAYKGEIDTACNHLENQGVLKKAIDVYKQAVKDIVVYDKVTTQALSKNFDYFKDVNQHIRDVFVENKSLLKQSSDITHESTIKTLYNNIYEKVVCNDKIADKLIHTQTQDKGLQPTYQDIEVRMRDLNVTDKDTIDRAYLHVLERFEGSNRETLSNKQIEAICARSAFEETSLYGWYKELQFEELNKAEHERHSTNKIMLQINAEKLALIEGNLFEQHHIRGEQINEGKLVDRALAIFENRKEKLEEQFKHNHIIREVAEENKQVALIMAENIIDHNNIYGRNLTTERLGLIKDMCIEQATLNDQISEQLKNKLNDFGSNPISKQQLDVDIKATKIHCNYLFDRTFKRQALEASFKVSNSDFKKHSMFYDKDVHHKIVDTVVNHTCKLQKEHIQQKQSELNHQLSNRRNKGFDMDR